MDKLRKNLLTKCDKLYNFVVENDRINAIKEAEFILKLLER